MQTDTFSQGVAGEIRASLARHRLTQAALAEFMGWNPSSLSRVLNHPNDIDLEMLEQIGTFLGITPTELVARAAAT